MTTQLTSPASVGRSSVLADHLGADSLVKDALMVLAGASLVGVLAQVSVPMWPVPITGQTLGVLLVGARVGAQTGLMSGRRRLIPLPSTGHQQRPLRQRP